MNRLAHYLFAILLTAAAESGAWAQTTEKSSDLFSDEPGPASKRGSARDRSFPLLVANFNDEKDPAVRLANGAQLGVDGSGVSGKPGDRCYLAQVEDPEFPKGGPVAKVTRTLPVAGLEEVTLTFWYKSAGKQVEAVTLFDLGGMCLIVNKTDWTLRVASDLPKEQKMLAWYGTSPKGPHVDWLVPRQWIFVAAIWRKSPNEVRFYQGTPTQGVKLSRVDTRKEGIGALLQRAESDHRPDVIGNSLSSEYSRPFNGSIDNLRYFPRAIDEAAIEKIAKPTLLTKHPNRSSISKIHPLQKRSVHDQKD